jgi:hypothetical protein
VTALLHATSPFAPGGNAGDASSASVTTAIAAIQSTDLCPESLFQGKLAEFYSQCPTELTSNSNPDVINIYDVLYMVLPMKEVICSKDDNDNYCVLQPTGPNSDSNSASSPSVQRSATAAITPNMTAFRDSNIPFLFRQPSFSATELCTTCTRQVFNVYANFETAVYYAPGLAQSPMLAGQPDLYNAIQNQCGPNFLQTSIQAAGDISGSSLFSGAGSSANSPGSLASTIMGLMSLAITLAI